MKHNHITRDIKPRGECPKCDLHHKGADHSRLLELDAKMRSIEEKYNGGLTNVTVHLDFIEWSKAYQEHIKITSRKVETKEPPPEGYVKCAVDHCEEYIPPEQAEENCGLCQSCDHHVFLKNSGRL